MVSFRFGILAIAIGVFTLPGCGETSTIPKTVEVAGTVTLNSEPLTEGMVNFSSSSTGDAANAKIGPGGRFFFGNGVLPGSYRVTITPVGSDTPPAPGVAPPTLNLEIPTKYNDLATTDLKATVAPGSDEFTFDLK